MSEVQLERRDLAVAGNIAWWGMALFIIAEAALFAFLFFTYYYLAIQPRSEPWPAGGFPDFSFSIPNTIILIVSGAIIWLAPWAVSRDVRWLYILALTVVFILGLAYLGIEFWEWTTKRFSLYSGIYGSVFFTIAGFHVAHIILGLLILLALIVWSALGYYGPHRSTPIYIGTLYWYFIIAVWLALFFTFYGTPYLGLTHGR